MTKAEEVVIEIPLGRLKGLKEQNFRGDVFFSFLGIPYAKPPVGDLRFKVSTSFSFYIIIVLG